MADGEGGLAHDPLEEEQKLTRLDGLRKERRDLEMDLERVSRELSSYAYPQKAQLGPSR